MPPVLSRLTMRTFVLFSLPLLPFCHAAILPRGRVENSLVAGLNTLTHPELSDPRTTLNAVLEQYAGILPPVTIATLRSSALPINDRVEIG